MMGHMTQPDPSAPVLPADTDDVAPPPTDAPGDGAVTGPLPADVPAPRQTAWPAVVLALAALAAYLTLSLARWNRWDTPSWDNAIFEQGIRGWANLGWPIVDIKGHEFNQLGDHFSPIIALVAPFYRLFPSPVTLLVAQCVLVAVSVVPLTMLARRRLGPASGLLVGVAYASSWGVQSAIDVQFHEYAFAAPILAFGLAAALDKRWRAACVWIGLLMAVKEDMGLTVAGFGVVLWIWGERRRAWQMIGLGLGGMALVLGVIIPIFNPRDQYDYWGKLGEDGGDSAVTVGSLVAGAWRIAANFLVPGQKVTTLLLIVAITGLVALRSPLLLMIVPTMVWRFAGSTEFYWGPTWHYSLILMPIMFVAAIDGCERLRTASSRLLRVYGRSAPVVMLLVSAALTPSFPLADLARPGSYVASDHASAGKAALAAIPAGSSVTTDLGLIVRLATEHRAYWVGTDGNPATDYVAIRTDTGWGADAPTDVAAYAELLYPGHTYETVFDDGGYLVARRTS